MEPISPLVASDRQGGQVGRVQRLLHRGDYFWHDLQRHKPIFVLPPGICKRRRDHTEDLLVFPAALCWLMLAALHLRLTGYVEGSSLVKTGDCRGHINDGTSRKAWLYHDVYGSSQVTIPPFVWGA